MRPSRPGRAPQRLAAGPRSDASRVPPSGWQLPSVPCRRKAQSRRPPSSPRSDVRPQGSRPGRGGPAATGPARAGRGRGRLLRRRRRATGALASSRGRELYRFLKVQPSSAGSISPPEGEEGGIVFTIPPVGCSVRADCGSARRCGRPAATGARGRRPGSSRASRSGPRRASPRSRQRKLGWRPGSAGPDREPGS